MKTDALRQKLGELLNAGLLTVRIEKAKNGRGVEYYGIAYATPTPPSDEEIDAHGVGE